ncbi:MAG: hypothetical protein U9N55_00200 [candidate division Zixibacteria bacterium]|nr:hypothetical protein [candidate division Zixibacteria bacterium]
MYLKFLLLTMIFLCSSLLAGNVNRDNSSADFDIMNLVGEWEGEGFFVVPATDIKVEIEGDGLFVYDSTNHRMRTSMNGTSLFINYADSGYLQYYPKTDSVSWEIWDSWGRHSMYWGVIDSNILRADRIFKNGKYRVKVTFPHPDTLDFHLRKHVTDSSNLDRAAFLLWRKKD